MRNNYQAFKDLHHQKSLFLIGNVWDVSSALALEKSGFEALGTSSAAVASCWGYNDGENIPFDLYLTIIDRIIQSVKIPVSVDIESGYGKSVEEITRNIIKLYDMGVAGINIEDSWMSAENRYLLDHNKFAFKLKSIIENLNMQSINIFINVRCDAYLLNKADQVRMRIKAYEQAGAEGIFLPSIVKQDDIKTAVESTQLPVNVMAVPGMPSVSELSSIGVKRVSTGNFAHQYLHNNLSNSLNRIINEDSFNYIFS